MMNRSRRILPAAAPLAVALFVQLFQAIGATLYVGPAGKDINQGSPAEPLATLEAARDAARKVGNGPHRIAVMPGEYFLERPLELDARDNGLTIEAVTNGAVLYGGVRVTGWKREGDNLWHAELPGVREGTWDFRALLVDGRLAERACYPGTNTFENLGTWNLPLLPAVAGHWERKPTREELTTMPYDPKDIPATLDVRNAEVRMYHMWAESLVGVTTNDTQRHALILSSEPAWPPGALNRRKYVIYNTREGMTRPGQWYLDRTSGRLVYWPLPEEDMAKSRVIAPTAERIIALSGSGQKPVENITLRGLVLQATTAPLKPASFGATAFDGAIRAVNARRCVFANLEICNVGGLGISADRLAECSVTGCHIHHVGACGAKISGTGTLIARNHIHHLGIYYPSAAATMLGGDRVHIYRNEIHDAPYSGIISGGGGKGNLIEENLIYRVMRELHDGAAIYGNMNACVIRGNVVRDVVEVGKGFGASAYYLDEGSRDCIIERNVAQGVPMPTHNHITRNTVVRDNVFMTDKDMTVSFARSVGCTFERNTLFCPGQIKINQPNGIRVWKGNVIFRNGPGTNDATRAFTISDEMPSVSAPGRKTWSAEATRADAAPALDGEIAAAEWPGKIQTLDREPSRFTVGGAPALVKLCYDDRCLYVGATVTMFAPAKVSAGSVWGKDDGVEICIAGKAADGKPATFVVRGYANGVIQSATDAGAPEDAAAHLGKGLHFAAKLTKGPGDTLKGWRGEWAIPFEALGLKPVPGLKVAFNMGAFCSEFGEWHCWEGTGAENWRLEQAGTLQFK
ncbi:MAG TPA: right-handed parallel beta-helix repeat-containing protein [Verrucomicrobiae bacterium]|nr:right-handed parallel beta-helix repeat-containing protein [Verrucomicrobiae bacterium]